MAIAMFAAGCFWGVEATFQNIPGVLKTTVGYTDGHTEQPTYAEVCTDTTGHAEAIEIEFDPALISYEKLLEIFWNSHNPTQLNHQGVDVGKQYRSAIFYHDAAQQQIALQSKRALIDTQKFSKPIVTEIIAASAFYPAEEYHQHYFDKHGISHCHIPGQDTSE